MIRSSLFIWSVNQTADQFLHVAPLMRYSIVDVSLSWTKYSVSPILDLSATYVTLIGHTAGGNIRGHQARDKIPGSVPTNTAGDCPDISLKISSGFTHKVLKRCLEQRSPARQLRISHV